MQLGPEDQARVGEAVAAAERATDGEVIAMLAESSDGYRDLAWMWAGLAPLLLAALVAAFPARFVRAADLAGGGWEAWSPGALLAMLAVLLGLVWLLARALFAWDALRLALTPGAIKARRVRARARLLFRTAIEARTATRTGVLLYLSLAERRAEIVADAAIHARVAPEAWGEAMAALLAEVRAGRPANGIVAAIERIGALLAEHFPHTGTDPNELPDRLILL